MVNLLGRRIASINNNSNRKFELTLQKLAKDYFKIWFKSENGNHQQFIGNYKDCDNYLVGFWHCILANTIKY